MSHPRSFYPAPPLCYLSSFLPSDPERPKRARVRCQQMNFGHDSLGSSGLRLGFRHCSAHKNGGGGGDSVQVAKDLREYAEEQEDSGLKAIMILGAETIEKLGMRIEELEEQLCRVRELLREQRDIMETLPYEERTAYKSFQTFILDTLDAMDAEGDAEGRAEGGGDDDTLGSSSSAGASAAVEPEPTPKPSKAEREGAEVIELLTAIYRLENKGMMAEAAALRQKIPPTKVLGDSAVNKAAADLEYRLFKVGGYGTIMKVLTRMINRPLVKQAMLPPAPPAPISTVT
jgi:hypothetical protein